MGRIGLMILPILVFVAGGVPNTPPVVTLTGIPKAVHSGSVLHLGLKLHFADGLHGYQNPPSDEYQIPVKVTLVSGAKLVSVQYPKGIPMKLGDNPPVNVYSGDVTVTLTLKAPKKSGPVVFSVNYQQCTEASCFPPSTLIVKGNLPVSP